MKSRRTFFHRAAWLALILVLTGQACTFSLFKFPEPAPNQLTPVVPPAPTATPLPRAQVTFIAILPEPLAPGEVLTVSVLDEVTGLALNPTDYPMQPRDQLTYAAALAIPNQAVVKYRYVRRSASLIYEDSNIDSSIRYRMFYVNGQSEVTDTINSWVDKSANSGSGHIFGTILNSDTNAPIPDILVTAGGVQTLTDSAGRFLLAGLRTGVHNVVAYALDGNYQTFQQGASVVAGAGTNVEIKLKPAQLVNVVFTARAPQNTVPGAPVRLAGNLIQLGNTFADLRGGLSLSADRMPLMTSLPNGSYSVSLYLPVGAYIQYKYTLGDGFWNSEHKSTGEYQLRDLVVQNQNMSINDSIESWQSGPNAPILFEATAPANTPLGDVVYIQFNPFGWTEPIPMWPQGNNVWVYKLYSPLNVLGSFGYRYCRNGQCGAADDVQTVGENARRQVTTSLVPQDIKDTIGSWSWLQTTAPATLVAANIQSHGIGFMAGVEYESYYEPNWVQFNPPALQNIQALGANWVVYTPSWTFARSNPLVFAEQPGKDPFWVDTSLMVSQARPLNINVAIFPQPRFATSENDFWKNAPRDPNWWINWFDHYRAFAVHYGDLATQSGAQALILGGDEVTPALPNGTLDDGSPSGVPSNAEANWKAIIAEVKNHYRGVILWALPFRSSNLQAPVNILQDTNGVYLLWSIKLSDQTSPSKDEMIGNAGNLLDNTIAPLQSLLNKPVIIALAYPSAANSATGCISNTSGGCLDWTALNRPSPDIPSVGLDLQVQTNIYEAMLNAINARPWVSGLVSRGFYPPATLQDKSASVHGKPTADLLWYWFPRLLGNIK